MPRRKHRVPPKKGSTYEKHFKGKRFVMVVVEENGRVLYEVEKSRFPTPTAAAKSITHHEVNGWDFWRMD
jgi:hypothetical protein